MLHTVFYAIIFLLALVISNVINKIFPKFPLTLIQVLIGLLLGFFGAGEIIHVQSEVFLAFIIAPLLFREAEEVDVKRIFKHSKLIIVLIFPLVFITAVGLGYLTYLVYAAIPLAAAIALGAALAPTDAVAVASLSSRFSFPRQVVNILKGEGLLNDASGIIAFQIALLALTTGAFSVVQASTDLIIAALGGAAVGALLVWLKNLILTLLEEASAQDVSGYVMIELIMPLAAFFIADLLGLSGIIAVVVAGVFQANGLKRTTLFDAQMEKVKTTIWDTLNFILNAVVFMFLGIELYQLVLPLFHSSVYSNTWLLFMAVLLTLALFAIRYVILSISYIFIARRHQKRFSSYMRDILILTFSGTKGTVSIAAILLLPTGATTTYSLLVFLCTAVTLLSFLLGMTVLPLLVTPKKEQADNAVRITILSDVITELKNDMTAAKEKSHLAYRMAIDTYQDRIQTLIIEQESFAADYNELQLLIMRLEHEGLENAMRRETISLRTYQTYSRYLRSLEQSLIHHLVSNLQLLLLIILRTLHFIITRLLRLDIPFLGRKYAAKSDSIRVEINELYFSNTELILQALENLTGIYDSQLIAFLQSERLRAAEAVVEGGHITRLIHQDHPNNLAQMMRAYYLERKIIFEYELDGKLSPREARDLRQTVNTMEDYTLGGGDHSLLFDFMNFRGNKKA